MGVKMNKDKICTCRCHVKGSIVKHIKPCCNHTYVHYINKKEQKIIK